MGETGFETRQKAASEVFDFFERKNGGEDLVVLDYS